MASIQQLVEGLNSDLSNEYKHFHFYLNAAVRVQGLHRAEVREFLLNEVKSEMSHILEFADLLLGLGGNPTTNTNGFLNNLTDPKAILNYALAMEDEVVNNYVQRKDQARKLGGVNGAVIEAFLDNQILASRHDADNIRQMLVGV